MYKFSQQVVIETWLPMVAWHDRDMPWESIFAVLSSHDCQWWLGKVCHNSAWLPILVSVSFEFLFGVGFSWLKNHVTGIEMGFDFLIYFENHMGLDTVAVIYEFG